MGFFWGVEGSAFHSSCIALFSSFSYFFLLMRGILWWVLHGLGFLFWVLTLSFFISLGLLPFYHLLPHFILNVPLCSKCRVQFIVGVCIWRLFDSVLVGLFWLEMQLGGIVLHVGFLYLQSPDKGPLYHFLSCWILHCVES